MHTDASTPEHLDRLELLVDSWLCEQLAENPVIEDVVRDTETDERRWWVRVLGEEKSVFSVWVVLRQRTLSFETYVMPYPEERAGELFEHLLRRNRSMFGYSFGIGDEEGIYLTGQIPNPTVTPAELDRMLGSLYQYVEQFFRPAMRIGFGSKFPG